MKPEKIILAVLFGSVFGYLVLRAFYVPFSHDEAATFFQFVHLGRFLPFHSEWSTNNHLLNSFLTFISYKLLGPAPFVQRLPNLLFIPLFFWFTARVSFKLQSRIARWLFILPLVLTHAFLELFALSRGYGMGLALLAGAVYYGMLALETGKSKNYLFATVFVTLSVSAVLTLINTAIVLLGILSLNIIVKDRGDKTRLFLKLFYLLVFGLLPLVIFTAYLLGMQDAGRIDYGGMEGFWPVTAKGLMRYFYGKWSVFFNPLVILLFAALVSGFAYRLTRQKNLSLLIDARQLLFLLLTGTILGFILEHHIFNVLYPDERAAVPFLFLFAGSLAFAGDQILARFRVLRIVSIAPLVLLGFHMAGLLNLNFTTSDTHNYNIPDSFFTTIRHESDPQDYPATIQGYQLRSMRWNFKNFMLDGELSCIHFSTYPSLSADYQVVSPSENPGWKSLYKVREKAPDSDLALLERKVRLQRQLVHQEVKQDIHTKETYTSLASIKLDTLQAKALYAGFSLSLVSKAAPFHAWIVAEVRDKKDAVVLYESVPLDWYRTHWDDPNQAFINGLLLDKVPGNANSCKIYLWNIYADTFHLQKSRVEIFELH